MDGRVSIVALAAIALAMIAPARADDFYPLEAQAAKFRAGRTGQPMAEEVAPLPAPDRPSLQPQAMPPQMSGEPALGSTIEEKVVEMPAETWLDRCMGSFAMNRTDPDDPRRFLGWGTPMRGTSWLNRPYYLGIFAGGLIGDDLQVDVIEQGGGFIAGGRFGIDFDHYWGTEARLAFSDLVVDYDGLVRTGQSNVSMFDANLLYYPTGDTRWRPYLSIGFGIHNFAYETALGEKIRASAIALPIGLGFKYALTNNIALRMDFTDNIAFQSGDQSDTMQNLSFTGGLELHFGGRRTMYTW